MPLSWLYGSIQDARNALYRKGVFKRVSLEVPTISVGNITVGGTGKTPLVSYIAEILAERGERVCILTRGYGRANPRIRVLVCDRKSIFATPKEAGDEPYELARKLIGKSYIIADKNRVAAGNWARQRFRISAFVLDDAFQHQKLKRDLNIVTIDASKPFGNGKTMPFGILRERLSNLKRADLIVVTRSNLTNEISSLKILIAAENPKCPIIISENKVCDLINIKEINRGAKLSTAETKTEVKFEENSKILAFCALGNAENFFAQLKLENYDVVATKAFPDHHFYDHSDIAKIEQIASEAGANALFTTAKDAVKLKGLDFEVPCFVVENQLIFDDDAKLRAMIEEVFN